MEQACAQDYSDITLFPYERVFSIDENICTHAQDWQKSKCYPNPNPNSYSQCHEWTETYPVCSGFLPGSTTPFCDGDWNELMYFPFHESSCENPFSIPGVTGLRTCNKNTVNDMAISGQLDGHCRSIHFVQQQANNIIINNNSGDRDTDTTNGTQGGESGNFDDDTQGGNNGGTSSQANIVVNVSLFSLLITFVVTRAIFVLVGA